MSSVARKRIPPPRDPAAAVYAAIDACVAESALDHVTLSPVAIALGKRLMQELYGLDAVAPAPWICPSVDDGLSFCWSASINRLHVRCRADNAVEARANVTDSSRAHPPFAIRTGSELLQAIRDLAGMQDQ